MAINTTNLIYRGQVEVKMRVNNKLITIGRHNEGTIDLFKSFAKFLTNNANQREDTPQYLDVQYQTEQGDWKSLLIKDSLSIESATWTGVTATFIIPLTFDDLIRTVVADDGYTYRLVLYSGDARDNLKNKALAYLEIESKELARISPGTRALIEWSMKVMNG